MSQQWVDYGLQQMDKIKELASALNGLLTGGAIYDPEDDPKITAAIREAVRVMDRYRKDAA